MTVALVLDAVSFAYPGAERPVLDEVTAGFRRGTVAALTGPSGSGKSTLLFVVGLLLRPLAGQITIDGHETSTWNDARRAAFRASTMGFVFQDAALDHRRSVLDNVLEPALYADVARDSLRARALALIDSLGVDVAPERRPGEISGGQAQRIGLARALVARPHFLLADEPTGNLDTHTAGAVISTLRAVADEGGCVVIATHDPKVVQAADTVVAVHQ